MPSRLDNSPNQPNTCLNSLPLFHVLPSPLTDLSSTSDLWVGLSGGGNHRSGYILAALSIDYQAFSPTSAGSDKSLRLTQAVPGVLGGCPAANLFPGRRRMFSARLHIHFRKHGPRSPPACLSLERPATSGTAALHWRLETIENDTNQHSPPCQETRKFVSPSSSRSGRTCGMPSDVTLGAMGSRASPPESPPEASVILLSGRWVNE